MWIEPLNLEYWIRNVFSGSTIIFTAIMLIFITMLAGYFKMTGMMLILMFATFMIMFYNYVDQSLYFLLFGIGALLIGYWIKRIISTR